MVSVQEREWTKSVRDVQEARQAQQILNCIVQEKVIMLEMIVERFPGIRWGDLFSTLGRFRREGLISIHQVGPFLEVRMKEQG